jgi:hypothetical protein
VSGEWKTTEAESQSSQKITAVHGKRGESLVENDADVRVLVPTTRYHTDTWKEVSAKFDD